MILNLSKLFSYLLRGLVFGGAILLTLVLIGDSNSPTESENTTVVPTEMPQDSENLSLDEAIVVEEFPPNDVSIERGEALSPPCQACHGTDGNATVPEYSNIAGQNEKYLLKQLRLIQSKEREIVLMIGQLDRLSDDDLKSLAKYYASLPGLIGQAKTDTLELGETIYRAGIKEKEVPACTACHSPYGSGNFLAGFPRVSGQTVPYLVVALKQYRDETRTSDEDVNGMMRDIAKKLTDEEIEAVANYMTGLY